ncbi:unnamed protein product [Urochloa humidicola]
MWKPTTTAPGVVSCRAAHPLLDGDGAGRSASGQETEEDYGCSIPATLLLEPAPECLPTPPLLDGDMFDA